MNNEKSMQRTVSLDLEYAGDAIRFVDSCDEL